MFILTHPNNFPCGRKPEHREKTDDFLRQSVDRLFSTFSHESVARIEPHDLRGQKGACSDGKDIFTRGIFAAICLVPTLTHNSKACMNLSVFRAIDWLQLRHIVQGMGRILPTLSLYMYLRHERLLGN